MSKKGYWVIVSRAFVGKKSYPGQAITDFPEEYQIKIVNDKSPINGVGKSYQRAFEIFKENWNFYSRNDPELIPPIMDSNDDKPEERSSLRHEFIDIEDLKAA